MDNPNLNRSGRKPGSLSIKKADIWQACKNMGFDAAEAMVKIAMGDVECGACRGGKFCRYPVRLSDGEYAKDEATGEVKMAARLCQSCWGTGYEPVNVKERIMATSEIMARQYPTLKAIEHSNPDGNFAPSIRIEYVNSPVVIAEPGDMLEHPPVRGIEPPA